MRCQFSLGRTRVHAKRCRDGTGQDVAKLCQWRLRRVDYCQISNNPASGFGATREDAAKITVSRGCFVLLEIQQNEVFVSRTYPGLEHLIIELVEAEFRIVFVVARKVNLAFGRR